MNAKKRLVLELAKLLFRILKELGYNTQYFTEDIEFFGVYFFNKSGITEIANGANDWSIRTRTIPKKEQPDKAENE